MYLRGKLIEHMNLVVEPGQMVAIVGRNWCRQDNTCKSDRTIYEVNIGEIILMTK